MSWWGPAVPAVGAQPTPVDLRFAIEMIQHHEAAIRAASEQLRQGTDPEMLFLANRILAAQNAEIAQFHDYLSRQGVAARTPNAYPSMGAQLPTQQPPQQQQQPYPPQQQPYSQQQGNASSADFRFAASMIPHHEAAIEASSQVLQQGSDPEILALAEKIIKAQQAEVIQLRDYLNRHKKSYVLVPPGRFDIVSGLLGVAAIIAAPRLPDRASSAVEMGGAMLIGASLHSYLMRVFGHL